MASQTKCPHCQHVLKLKSDAAVGRKVPCPKCSTPFTIKLMATKPRPAARPKPADEWEDNYDDAPYDDYDAYDDYDDYEADDQDGRDDHDEPPRRASSGSKSGSRSKKKKKSSGTPKWLIGAGIGVGAILVLGLLAGLVSFAISNLGGSNRMNLAWMPEDADLFMQVRPNELWNAPMLAPARESEFMKLLMAQAAQNGQMNVEPGDIETVTVAGVDMIDMYKQRTALFGARLGQPQLAQKADPKMLAVVRLKRDLTEGEIMAADAQKRDHAGKSIYVRQTPQGEQASCLADARTILVGHVSQVTAAIDRGSREPRVKRIDFINPKHQFVVVMAPPKVIQPTTDKPMNTPGARLDNAMNKGARSGYFALSVNSDLELEVGVDCFGSSEATEIKESFDAAMVDATAKFDQQMGQAPPQFSQFVDIGRETMQSLKGSKSGSRVTLTGKVPGRLTAAIQEAIASNPLAGMMMNGMMQQLKSQMPTPPPGGTSPGGASPGMTTPGMTTPGADSTSITPGSPDDADMNALLQERRDTQGTLDGIRGQIKSTTGSIQDAVPGGK